jgi:hypothetical protein
VNAALAMSRGCSSRALDALRDGIASSVSIRIAVVLALPTVYGLSHDRSVDPLFPDGDRASLREALMESWIVLPESPLSGSGPASESFRQIGCASYRSAARHLHELPYGRNRDRADFMLVLPERRGTCSTKHALLAAVALEQKLPVALTIGIYDMSEANTPGVGRVLSAHGLESIPEAHCYLRYADRRVDITRAGVSPQASIDRFREEWTIEPAQIGAHKVELHQRYLRNWLREQNLAFSFVELWGIREKCIQALGSDAPKP